MKVGPGQLFKNLRSRTLYEVENFRSMGLYEAGRLATDRAFQRLCLSRFRTAMRPSLHQLHEVARSMHMSASAMVEQAFPTTSPSKIKDIEAEYSMLEAELAGRYTSMNDRLNYPEWYAIERETSFLLYSVCRLAVPENVLETGVANGRSSFFWLRAMMKNGRGRLHSVDVSSDVGQLLTDEEKQGWSLHVLKAPQRGSFTRVLDSVSPIDIFFHDSDHTYGWQVFEYRTALKMISPEGIFLGDDVDHSLAFFDFCNAIGRKPFLLMDTRKVCGLLLPEK